MNHWFRGGVLAILAVAVFASLPGGMAPPAQAAVVAAARLPGASYPWIEPVWVRVAGIMRPVAPKAALNTASVEPPAWILAA